MAKSFVSSGAPEPYDVVESTPTDQQGWKARVARLNRNVDRAECELDSLQSGPADERERCRNELASQTAQRTYASHQLN